MLSDNLVEEIETAYSSIACSMTTKAMLQGIREDIYNYDKKLMRSHDETIRFLISFFKEQVADSKHEPFVE